MLSLVISPRGPLAIRRMTAHWVVLAAAVLATLVAATMAAALTVFTGQALPLAVKHDLATAPNTAMSITTLVSDPSQAATGSAALRSRIAAAIPGLPFSFDEALWSDPMELVPGALPAVPPSAGKGNTALLQAASLSGIASHASLVAGQWPTAQGSSQRQAIPAALPVSAAALLHVSVGDVLRLRDRITNALVSFDITGLFVPRPGSGPADSYWMLSYIPASGRSASYGSTTYGPLVVSQAALGSTLTMFSASWVAQPDMTAFHGDPNSMSASVAALAASLPNSSFLNGGQLVSSLPSVLAATASNLAVARLMLVISALELLVLAIAALVAVARLLATQREGETALLVARGATRSQLTWLTAAEVVPLSALVSVAGAFAGIRLAGVLVTSGSLGSAGIRLSGLAGIWPDALGAAIAVTVLAAALLLAPGLTPSPGAARTRRGRQAVVTVVAQAGLDVALVVLAVLACWQLRHYSAASGGGTVGIDPVLALAPALALAAGSVATLRLLPLAARTADWLAIRGRRLTASLASWRLSRLPVRQGGAALLLTMAVATGTLALAQHASWLKSASDQAAFTNGGDVQVDLPAPLEPGAVGAVAAARGVTHAMSVSLNQAGSSEVMGVDAAQAAKVVLLRADQSPLPSSRLFSAITPGTLPGAVLPAPQSGARAGTIRLTATLGADTAGAATVPTTELAAQLGPVTVTLTVLDQAGSAYQIVAGTLVADSRPHLLVAPLGGERASYPLRVVAITVAFVLPQSQGPELALSLSGLSLGGWTEEASSLIPDDVDRSAVEESSAGTTSFTRQAATFTFDAGWADTSQLTESPPPPTAPIVPGQLVLLPPATPVAAIPAIATKAYMDANSLAIGSVVNAFDGGAEVPLQVVAEVTSFPTVTESGGALITDLGSLQEYLARQSLPPLPVTQWWLATAGGGVPPSLTAAVPAGTDMTNEAALATANASDTLSAAPQQALLAMAAAAVLLAITGFWVSIAADVRRRRGETALLAALGVTRRDAALQLCLEKLLLSLPSAVLGVLLGTLVAWLLVPAVTLNPAAQLPTPAPITVHDLPQAIALALAVAVLPAVAAALAGTRRPDPAAELRAEES
jgi:ABC-type antimicrobial peptide transport system permease subunit